MANFIHIGEQSKEDGAFKILGYRDLTEEAIDEIVQDDRIKWIQIDENLSDRAYREIDRILERKPDLYFRIFGIGTYGIIKSLDLSVLSQMPHVSKIRLDGDFTENRKAVNLESLKLKDLKHITTLPDFSRLTKLKELQIDNVPIALETVDSF